MGKRWLICLALVMAAAAFWALSALLFGSAPARAAPGDLFATPNGTGDCSQATPCDLQTALAHATDGNTIYLAGGIYTGTGAAVITVTRSITLYGGWDGDTTTPPVRDPDTYITTLDGEGERRVVYIGPGVTAVLEGLRITNGSTASDGGGVYVAAGASPTIHGCWVFSNTAADSGGGMYLSYGDGVTLTSNVIYSNVAQYGGGLSMMMTNDAILVNNIIVENSVTSSGMVPGIKLNGSTAYMLHNTIARNRGGDGRGVYLGTNYVSGTPYYSTAAMTNTILVSHTVGIYVNTGSTATLEATLWGTGAWANGSDWSGSGTILTGTVNIWNWPGFLDPDHGDYHLGFDSAAIGTGWNAGVLDDIDGDPRPFCEGIDIGADEYACCVSLHNTQYSTVQAAVDLAQDGDLVKVAGTCQGVQTRGSERQVAYVTKTLTIRGGYNDEFTTWDPQVYPTTLDALGQGRVVKIGGPGITVTLEWLRLTNGSGFLGGGVYAANAHVVISSCHIFSNTASLGGGVYLDRSPHSRLMGSRIYSNTATAWGGGLYLLESHTTTLEYNDIYGNAASGGYGGGAYLDQSIDVTLTGNEIFDNQSSDDGGGIYLYESDRATLTGNDIHGNSATGDDGGGLYLYASDNATLTGNHVYSNTAGTPNGQGGGIYFRDSANVTLSGHNEVHHNTREGLYFSNSPTATLTDNEVHHNTLGGVVLSLSPAAALAGNEVHDNGWGGVLVSSSDNVTLSGNRIYNNRSQRGGGLYLYYSDNATLAGNEIYSNTAWFESGGGVYLLNSVEATLTGNEIYSNTASGGGGGIYLTDSPTATLTGNRIYSNTASSGGGGVYLTGSPTATLTENRIYSNIAAGQGGGILLSGSNGVTLARNLIFRNEATGGGGLFLSASWDSMLVNNMVAENRLSTTTGDGAGIYLIGSTVRCLHTTLARNSGGGGQGIYVAFLGGNAWMTNTVLVSHTVGIEVELPGGAAALEATLWGSGAWANQTDWIEYGTLVTGTVNIWGDPAFLDPASGDYHLGPGSAAIDVGVDVGVTADIDGDQRPIGPAPDLGADEAWRWIYLPLVLRGFP